MTRSIQVGFLLGLICLASCLSVAPAYGTVRITSFSATPSTTQAGGHPNLAFAFTNTTRITAPDEGGPCHCNDIRDVRVNFPAGFIANVHATPQCDSADFAADECPVDSQVGIVHIRVEAEGGFSVFSAPVYNLIPKPDQPGLLGWRAPEINIPAFTVLSARTGGDYGLDAAAIGITQLYPIGGYEEEVWGVPAEPRNDRFRFPHPGVEGFGSEPTGASSDAPLTPFLQSPTRCAGPLTTTLTIAAYDGSQSTANSPWPATTGCDQLSFNPSLSAQPTTSQTDTPSGLEVDLNVPQTLSPSTPSQSEIRAASVTLPEGFTINSNAADGKVACSEAQAQLGPFSSTEAAQCPEFAKIGTDSITSAALPGPIPGGIYLGEPQPGNRYRLFLTADGFATHVKLAGTLAANPHTGQLTASFENLPQSPLTAFNLHFFGSERGSLATPTKCGTYAVHSSFTPWDEALAVQNATQFFSLESGPGGTPCPGASRSLSPSFAAGSTSNAAGVHSPFWIDLTRSDGEQNLSAVDVTTPPGLLATLKGISYCSDTALADAASPAYSGLAEEQSPSCPVASQIGTATVGAGAGAHPVYLSGTVYLAGPYRGAPLSLAVITPAVSGPYDLGNVVVRVALHVDPETAQVTAVSDPLPQILEGIPLRLRSLLVNLDRPGFTLNPTDCEQSSVGASVSGTEGADATPFVPFQVANCSLLPFAPKLATSLTGSTRQAGNPSLHSVLAFPQGGTPANVARISVTLPPTEFLAQSHIKDPCLRVQFAEGNSLGERCPPGSDIGFARAESPLLEKPIEGPVYLRASGRKLPDLVAALNGQIDIALVGHVNSVPGRLSTTFNTVPDAPVSRFSLTLDGGNKGLLENSPYLCSSAEHLRVKITGQNGKTANQNPILQTSCRNKQKRKKRMVRRSPNTYLSRRSIR